MQLLWKKRSFLFPMQEKKKKSIGEKKIQILKEKNKYNRIKTQNYLDNVQGNNYNDIYADCFSQDYNTNESNNRYLINNENEQLLKIKN